MKARVGAGLTESRSARRQRLLTKLALAAAAAGARTCPRLALRALPRRRWHRLSRTLRRAAAHSSARPLQLRDGRLPLAQRLLAALKLGVLRRELPLRPLQRCALRLRVHVHLGVGPLHVRAPRPLRRQLPFKRPPSLPLALQLVLQVCERILNLRQCGLR